MKEDRAAVLDMAPALRTSLEIWHLGKLAERWFGAQVEVGADTRSGAWRGCEGSRAGISTHLRRHWSGHSHGME
jgi:hypothetical protein